MSFEKKMTDLYFCVKLMDRIRNFVQDKLFPGFVAAKRPSVVRCSAPNYSFVRQFDAKQTIQISSTSRSQGTLFLRISQKTNTETCFPFFVN